MALCEEDNPSANKTASAAAQDSPSANKTAVPAPGKAVPVVSVCNLHVNVQPTDMHGDCNLHANTTPTNTNHEVHKQLTAIRRGGGEGGRRAAFSQTALAGSCRSALSVEAATVEIDCSGTLAKPKAPPSCMMPHQF